MSEGPLYLTAVQIDRAVRGLYEKSGCVVLSEVRNRTGYSGKIRTADMLAVSTWPSRGLYAAGVEIKVSRSDLASELKKPEKADAIAKYCKYWWLAVPEGLIIEGMAIPETWGIITVNDKLKAKFARPALDIATVPMDTAFVCSVLRKFSEGVVQIEDVNARVEAGIEARCKLIKDNASRHSKNLEESVARFEKASGLKLVSEFGTPRWDLGDIGEAVKLIVAMSNRPFAKINEVKQNLLNGVAAIDAALNGLEDVGAGVERAGRRKR